MNPVFGAWYVANVDIGKTLEIVIKEVVHWVIRKSKYTWAESTWFYEVKIVFVQI